MLDNKIKKIFKKRDVGQKAFLLAFLVLLGFSMLPAKTLVPSVKESSVKADEIDFENLFTGAQFYAAPNGSPSGDGSKNNPWDLKTALTRSASVVAPGSTVWLRGGVYKIPAPSLGFISTLSGTAQNPVRVASFPGEWAVIDGNLSQSGTKNETILKINGGYVWFMNFEVTNTETANRKIDVSGSNPPQRRGTAINDYSTGTKLINLVIHDAGQGIGAWASGTNNEYYGNVVYNNGWDAPDRNHGHGIYVQNNQGGKLIENNLFFNNFEMNAQSGGTSAASVRNLTWIGNTFFNGNMAWRGPNIENFKVIGNYFHNNVLKVGDSVSPTYKNAEVRDNYAMGGVQLFEFTGQVIFENNTVWNNNPKGKNLVINHNSDNIDGKFLIDNNIYYKSYTDYPYWQFKTNYYGSNTAIKKQFGDFAFNKTTGSQVTTYSYTKRSWTDNFPFDANSTYTDVAPYGLKVFFQPNRYDAKRANVIIYNFDQANAVGVDVSSLLGPGDTYELHNAQDYFGDVVRGTYSGGNLQVVMAGRTNAKPVGYDQTSGWFHNPLNSGTFPVFGAFVLIKTN
jgi:hypothetical protein